MIIRLTVGCLFIALTVLPCTALGDEWTKSLPQLEKSLTSAEATLRKIDVTQLTVVYQEGHWIEGARTRGLRYIELLRNWLRLPNGETTVFDVFNTVLALERLGMEIVNIIYQLDRPVTISAASRSKASEWSAALTDTSESVHRVTLRLQDDAFEFAGRVDRRLQLCR